MVIGMAKYIERDKIFSVWRSMPAPASVESLSAAIHQTPAIDIVQCKDCKHFCFDLIGRKNHLCMRKEVGFVLRRKADDFCSYGERYDNEN